MESGLSPCGINCHLCEWYKGNNEPKCPGCSAVEGKPFWGTCEVYACAKRKDVTHCGVCGEFPCDMFMNQYDPEEGLVYCAIRAGLLAYRAKHGDEKAVVLTRQVRELWTEFLGYKKEAAQASG